LRWKLSEISANYWNYLLKWIDFQSEIGHDMRFVGDKKTNNAKVSDFNIFFGKRS